MARKIRVALFFTTLHKGGTEAQAMLLLRNANRTKFELYVYAFEGGPLETEIRALGVPIRIMSSKIRNPFRMVRGIRRWMHEDGIEVLHCLLWHPNIIGRLACIGTDVHCINSVRWAERRPWMDWADYLTRPLVDSWIANSQHGAKLAFLPRRKTTIIHNGLPDTVIQSAAPRKVKPKTIIMVGRFRREKQYKELIAAAEFLPDWQFDLVGEGPLFDETKRYARRKHLKNVFFLGQRTDVHELLLQHEISILLSKSEGNPNVALESMALGVPFIGSNIIAHREILGHDRGILVKAEPRGIAAAIENLHAMEAAKRDAMVAAAKKYVQENYSTSKMVSSTQQLWSR